jgi:hypothetical protein
LSFAISIIIFISSALEAALVEVVVAVAGLDTAVVVVAELELAGAFGAADGVWAIAMEAVANRVVSSKVVCLMVGRFC